MSEEPAGKPVDDAGILLTWRESPPAARALLAGIFVNRLGAFIQIFLVLFLTDRGFSEVQAGAALAMYTAGAVVGVIVGGTLTDLLGPRRTILLSMSGSAVLVLSILYLRNYLALLVAVFVVGAVSGAYRPASSMLLSELTPKHRQVMIFAMYRLAYNLGNTAAPLIGAVLVAISYDLLFWGEAAAALGYAAVAAVALPRRDRAVAEEKAAGAAGRSTGYLAVLADRRYVLFLLAVFINAIVYVQYLSTLPVAMRAEGLGTNWFSAMVALNGVIVITCELLVTKVVQHWPMRVVVAVGFVLLGGGMAIYALPFGAAVFVVGTLVWSAAEIVAGPTVFAYPAIASPERLRGRYIGAMTALFGIGSAAGSVVGLAIWNAVGEAVWWWCAAACLIGVAAAWRGMQQAGSVPVADQEGAGAADPAAEGAVAEPRRPGAGEPEVGGAAVGGSAAEEAAAARPAAGEGPRRPDAAAPDAAGAVAAEPAVVPAVVEPAVGGPPAVEPAAGGPGVREPGANGGAVGSGAEEAAARPAAGEGPRRPDAAGPDAAGAAAGERAAEAPPAEGPTVGVPAPGEPAAVHPAVGDRPRPPGAALPADYDRREVPSQQDVIGMAPTPTRPPAGGTLLD
jgi:MFS family permease